MSQPNSDDLSEILEDPRDLDRLVDIFEGLTLGELQAVRQIAGTPTATRPNPGDDSIFSDFEFNDLDPAEILITDILRPLRKVSNVLEDHEFKYRHEALTGWPADVCADFNEFLNHTIGVLLIDIEIALRDYEDHEAMPLAYREYVRKGGRTGFILKAEPWTDYIHQGSNHGSQYDIYPELKKEADSYFWEFVIHPNNDGDGFRCGCESCLIAEGCIRPGQHTSMACLTYECDIAYSSCDCPCHASDSDDFKPDTYDSASDGCPECGDSLVPCFKCSANEYYHRHGHDSDIDFNE